MRGGKKRRKKRKKWKHEEISTHTHKKKGKQ
jgi:hypothetical protein